MVNVGKYTIPMDPMGLNKHGSHTNIFTTLIEGKTPGFVFDGSGHDVIVSHK